MEEYATVQQQEVLSSDDPLKYERNEEVLKSEELELYSRLTPKLSVSFKYLGSIAREIIQPIVSSTNGTKVLRPSKMDPTMSSLVLPSLVKDPSNLFVISNSITFEVRDTLPIYKIYVDEGGLEGVDLRQVTTGCHVIIRISDEGMEQRIVEVSQTENQLAFITTFNINKTYWNSLSEESKKNLFMSVMEFLYDSGDARAKIPENWFTDFKEQVRETPELLEYLANRLLSCSESELASVFQKDNNFNLLLSMGNDESQINHRHNPYSALYDQFDLSSQSTEVASKLMEKFIKDILFQTSSSYSFGSDRYSRQMEIILSEGSVSFRIPFFYGGMHGWMTMNFPGSFLVDYEDSAKDEVKPVVLDDSTISCCGRMVDPEDMFGISKGQFKCGTALAIVLGILFSPFIILVWK